MSEDFILTYAKLISSHPDEIVVETSSLTEDMDEITIYAHKQDLGKLIGKAGKMVTAIKTVVSGCKAKGGKSYKLNVRAVP